MRKNLKKLIRKFFPKYYRYYSRNYYKDKSFAIYNNIESLCKLFSIKDKQQIITSNKISLHTNISFGSTLRQIKKKLGKPSSYIRRSVSALDFKIMYYRFYLGGYKTKQEVHLYENNLFYFNYIFSYLSSSDKESLKKLICKKYLQKDCEILDKIIVDEFGNSLFITDNVDFTINYLNGDKSIPKEFLALSKLDKINRDKLIEQNQEELLIKL